MVITDVNVFIDQSEPLSCSSMLIAECLERPRVEVDGDGLGVAPDIVPGC